MGLVLAGIAFLPGGARADAIDGRWCFSDGSGMTIEGPAIVTPAGTRTTGIYDRHGFFYKVPESEPGAGASISMTLVNETTVHLWRGEKPGSLGRMPDQVWRRCAPVS